VNEIAYSEQFLSLAYGQVHLFAVLYSFAVVLLTLGPATEVLVEENAQRVNLIITASKPAESPYNVTICTMAGTAEG